MKFLSLIICLIITLIGAQAFAADSTAEGSLSQQGKRLSETCNLEARNSLVNGDLELVEKVCTQAIEEIEKTGADKKYLINPMMNMAVAFTLSGQYEKALPHYKRARTIGEKVYGPDSRDLKQIDDMIRKHEEMKAHQNMK